MRRLESPLPLVDKTPPVSRKKDLVEGANSPKQIWKMIDAIRSAEELLSRWPKLPREMRHQLLWEEVRLAYLLPAEESLLLTQLVLEAGDVLVESYPARMEIVRRSLEDRIRQHQVPLTNIICVDNRGEISIILWVYYVSYG